MYVFLHANDVHACYNAVELFEVFMIKQVYFVVKFTFLFSSLAKIALSEHNNQFVSEYSPKFPIFPQNIPGGNLPLSKFPGILHP